MPGDPRATTLYLCEWCWDPFLARRYERRRYCSRTCSGSARAQENGGLCFDICTGRWKIMCRDGTQLWYYRGVMAAEIGRLLRPDELVHHVNEDQADDRVENLEILSRAEHARVHAKERRNAR